MSDQTAPLQPKHVVSEDINQALRQKINECSILFELILHALRRDLTEGINDTPQRLATLFLSVTEISMEAAQMLAAIEWPDGKISSSDWDTFNVRIAQIFLGSSPFIQQPSTEDQS